MLCSLLLLPCFYRSPGNRNDHGEQEIVNIAKGTTDPRVEFIPQDHSSQFTNLVHITGFRISFKY